MRARRQSSTGRGDLPAPPGARLPRRTRVNPPAPALALALALLAGSAPACRNRLGTSEAPGVVATGGSAFADASETPLVVLFGGGREVRVRVELARTDPEHARGLMFRTHLDPDAGMLFVFPQAGPRSFWMKNTLIPLDMIFIGPDLRIVGIVEEAAPETLTPRRVAADSKYVLEIGGGLSRKLGVTAGSPVQLRGIKLD